MKEPICDYDLAAVLTDPDSIAVFVTDAFVTGDAAFIAQAPGVVAHAKGMTELAKESCLSRNSFTAHSAQRAIRH